MSFATLFHNKAYGSDDSIRVALLFNVCIYDMKYINKRYFEAEEKSFTGF